MKFLSAFALFCAVSLGASCSFILDFDNEDDLPCPCNTDSYVCLNAANRCVRKGSVELFKSCSLDTTQPDDLCPSGATCVDIHGKGPRCLPICDARSYSTPEAGFQVALECPTGRICFNDPRGGSAGVCSEGVCTDVPNNCPPPDQCVVFNGAGICFTPCEIFQHPACAGAQLCHPIGDSQKTACVTAGLVDPGAVCDDLHPCKQVDGLGRPLVCDKPAGSGPEAPRRCYAFCNFGSCTNCVAGETPNFSRPIESTLGSSLGLCVPN